jgi:predicted acyltransferase
MPALLTTMSAGPATPPPRLTSIDAYRGFVMLLMMGEVLRFCAVAAAVPQSAFWHLLCHHQEHVEWVGCSLHDLIQPSFSFLVGVALPFSIANRMAAGQSRGRLIRHSILRALALILLGIFLRSLSHPQTYFTFEDTLTQIGLGYVFLFLLGFRPVREQWAAFIVILVGFWAAFALYPLPGPDFDWAAVGVPKDWPHLLTGFEAHWNKNSNLAWAFDVWFLNLFPRESRFLYNDGAWSTLSFIPTLATMILGLIAGGVLRSDRPAAARLRWLVWAGVAGLASGWLLGALGVCPVVKRIWTPTFTLFTGGWCFLFLAGFYHAIDVRGRKAWAFPLIVVGMNSIAAYCTNWVGERFIAENLTRHLGTGAFRVLGDAYAPLLQGAVVLFLLWLVLLWMYRRRIFLRI